MIANALPRPLTAGSVDNAILRADGTGGTTLQNSDINIDDAVTSTQANVAITNQHAGQTNSAIVLTPKGTGALIAGAKPDGTTVGGNARGSKAICLVGDRSAATQVASGTNSVSIGYRSTASSDRAISIGGTASGTTAISIGGGTASGNSAIALGSSTASGAIDCSIAIGTGNAASGSYGSIAIGTGSGSSGNASVSIGRFLNSVGYIAYAFGLHALSNRVGMFAYSSGQFAIGDTPTGDAQRARFVMRNKTTTNSAVELFLDGSATRLTIPSGKVLGLTINICGISSTGAAVAHYMRQYALKNVSGTTTEVYAPITIGTDNAAGTSIALSASDASDALVVSVTGTASTIWRWVASVDAVEIAFGT
jgi:hypothetical protein